MTHTDASPGPPARHGPPVGRIILTVVGALLVVISLALGAAGAFLTTRAKPEAKV